MYVSERWGKEIVRRAGLAVPRGCVVTSPQKAADAARALAGEVVLKVQVAAGKRGKDGGVRFAATPEGARSEAARLLASTFAGMRVDRLLVEERVAAREELYAAVMNDARAGAPLVLLSAAGGMEIEEAHARSPERVARGVVDVRRGLGVAQARALTDDARIPPEHAAAVASFLCDLYAIYRRFDLELLEINPLAVTGGGALVALDCKLVLDDSARWRHAELVAEIEAAEPSAGTERERRARELGLLYIELGGDVGLLANGAGLTMATMDAVVHHGGRPANFLEIGGDAYTKATPALELVLSDAKVKSVVVNFCGAFARTDVMADGVIRACETLRPSVPLYFSVHGTGEQEAAEMLRRRLGVEPFDVMDDAVRAAIAAAGGAPAEAASA